MLFMYVYMESKDGMCGECLPLPISEGEGASCINGNLSILRSFIESEGLNWSEVTRIEVESVPTQSLDGYPDMDNPETLVCYKREC
jgi:hypothetical protein